MRRGFPGGLRGQLLVSLVGLLCVVFTLSSVSTVLLMATALREQAKENALVMANTLASVEATPESLESFMWRSGASLVARQRGGEWYVATVDRARFTRVIAAYESSGEEERARLVDLDGEEFVAARASGPLGASFVILGLGSAAARLETARERMWFYIALNALFVLAIGYALFTYLIVRPIRAIGVATERAGQGDFASPIKRISRNEIGQVAASFNLMLERLDAQREALERRLTELEEANAEIKRTQEGLLRSERLASVGHLAAGVAHEIGNPLAAVLGYVEMLEDDDLTSEERDEMTTLAGRQLDRIQTIVRELLDFSREDAGVDAAPVDLTECAREALHLAGAGKRSWKVCYVDELPESLPLAIAVPSRVVQVLINLLLNAADALEKGGGERVTLGAHVEETELVLFVEDDGEGVPDELRRAIFDPFFTTKEPGKGTGLGLSICARIMESQGGSLTLAAPEEGRGARFEARFQRA